VIIGSSISHYKIVKKLGEGGMGVVYKAEDTTLERTVALKFFAQHLLNDEEVKERFLREAKAAAELDHPNICTVYEIAEVDGKTFISMAFLKGETLEERISQGPLSLKDALDIARQATDGLEAAHEAAIVHHDIKPTNIMIDTKGRATIMDFGLARLTEASRLTKLDTAMGTVAYMSPEQAQGMEIDSRSDLWSLGCVLYEMVSGQRPFQGQYDQALLYEIVHEEPAALTGLRTGVTVELEFVANK
jgi:serine/threonine protein kinase